MLHWMIRTAAAVGERSRHASRPERLRRATMPSWTPKEEREYEHIKNGYEKRGKDDDTAEEIAARTVNKQRRENGETPNKRTEGTGNPNTPLENRTKAELENIARDENIHGRGSMKKDELVKAIQKHRH
jgi:plasmid stabilization system protein ParE